MEWNEETISRLRALWAEGHSTAEIGRRLGVSKNAVVGKAHRLQLPPRPSPIRRDGDKTPRRRLPRRATGPTLPTLAASLPPMPAEPPHVIGHAGPERSLSERRAAERPVAERPETERQLPAAERIIPVLRAIPASRPGARVTPCCWPIGEPGTKSFRFCDVDAIGGKPYCEDHSALAYVKVRDRKEDAA